MPVKAKLRQIEGDEDELLGIPDNWIPVRLMDNEVATPSRKAFALYLLQRA